MRYDPLKLLITALLISILWSISALAQQTLDERYLPTEKHQKPQNAKKAHKGWKLVWSDEFSGTEIDTDS